MHCCLVQYVCCVNPYSRDVVGRGRVGTASPHFFRQAGTRPPLPHFFGLKFVQKLVHCCNWLLAETQCKIISVQRVCRPKLFKSPCLSLVSGVPPHFFFRTTPLQAGCLYLPSLGHQPACGRTTEVCGALPLRHWTYGYLSSRRASGIATHRPVPRGMRFRLQNCYTYILWLINYNTDYYIF